MENISVTGNNIQPFIKSEFKNNIAKILVYGYAHADTYDFASKWFAPLYNWINKLPKPCNINLDFWFSYLEDEGYPLVLIDLISLLEQYFTHKKGNVVINWHETSEIVPFEQGNGIKNYNGGWKIKLNLINKAEPEWMRKEILEAYYKGGD